MFKIIPWNKTLEKQAIEFLEKHQETALFLLSNFINIGPHLTDHIYSGDYKLILKDQNIVAVFYVAKNGNILLQMDKQRDYSELILNACLEEPIPVTGVIGAWIEAKSCWDLLRLKCPNLKIACAKKEILYRLDLTAIQSFDIHGNIRFLKKEDFEAWEQTHKVFLKNLDLPPENPEDQLRLFTKEANKKHWWGLFINNELISTAAYNAVYKNLAQIGGVYTKPEMRGQGLMTQLMKQLIVDSKNIHHMDTLILFTDEHNFAAQKVYENVGFKRIGDFALLFGKF
ncbi:MAG: GNAT family N-acetyltransferase [Gammaproteobacteria bacterium]|nr:GNAT family N-acetyltransferase [Gammaproteobacteria bacterium]